MLTKRITDMTFTEKKILVEQILVLQKKLLFKNKFIDSPLLQGLLSDSEYEGEEPIIQTVLKMLPYEQRIIIMNDFWDKNENSNWYKDYWSKNTYYNKKHKAIDNILFYLYA